MRKKTKSYNSSTNLIGKIIALNTYIKCEKYCFNNIERYMSDMKKDSQLCDKNECDIYSYFIFYLFNAKEM
jgi:hypothetical protein